MRRPFGYPHRRGIQLHINTDGGSPETRQQASRPGKSITFRLLFQEIGRNWAPAAPLELSLGLSILSSCPASIGGLAGQISRWPVSETYIFFVGVRPINDAVGGHMSDQSMTMTHRRLIFLQSHALSTRRRRPGGAAKRNHQG